MLKNGLGMLLQKLELGKYFLLLLLGNLLSHKLPQLLLLHNQIKSIKTVAHLGRRQFLSI